MKSVQKWHVSDHDSFQTTGVIFIIVFFIVSLHLSLLVHLSCTSHNMIDNNKHW